MEKTEKMASRLDQMLDTFTDVIGGKKGKKQQTSKTSQAAAGAKGRASSSGSGMTDEAVQKLTRLELLEILVDQKKEIDALREKLEETQSRLERDDELIRRFLGRERPEMKVRRDVKDE